VALKSKPKEEVVSTKLIKYLEKNQSAIRKDTISMMERVKGQATNICFQGNIYNIRNQVIFFY
jgi:hypothetical protein